jgi:hypothetical protein
MDPKQIAILISEDVHVNNGLILEKHSDYFNNDNIGNLDDLDLSTIYVEEGYAGFMDMINKYIGWRRKNNDNTPKIFRLVFVIDDVGDVYKLRGLKAILDNMIYLRNKPGGNIKLEITVKGHDREKEVSIEPNVFASGIKWESLDQIS